MRVPGEATDKLLDAFEEQLTPILSHKLFNGWDACSLTRAKAEEWAEVWDMDDLLKAERKSMRARLVGDIASKQRRGGFRLLARVWEDVEEEEERGEDALRPAMYDLASNELHEEVVLWRRVQVRQAFRLALEALFEWVVGEIGGGTFMTVALAIRLLNETDIDEGVTAREWFEALLNRNTTVVGALEELQSCLQARRDAGAAALQALAVAVLSPAELHDRSDRRERLPIALAAADLERLGDGTPDCFIAHVIESWIIAQHTYWSVGRGLADARAGGKRILRLRLVLEPGGWRVTRGQGSRGIPSPTPDRLKTALSLALESGLVSRAAKIASRIFGNCGCARIDGRHDVRRRRSFKSTQLVGGQASILSSSSISASFRQWKLSIIARRNGSGSTASVRKRCPDRSPSSRVK